MSDRDDIDIDKTRRTLQALREQVLLGSEQGAEATRAVELDQTKVGRLSRMDALQGQEMARAAERRREQELRKIDAALARLDSGDYGWCVACGEEISAARLDLDPAAPNCIACATGSANA